MYGMDGMQLMLIIGAVIAVLIVVAIFVYTHTAGEQARALRSIDDRLKEGTPGAAAEHTINASVTIAGTAMQPAAVTQQKTEGSETVEEDGIHEDIMEQVAGNSAAANESVREDYGDIADMSYNVGRSGRAYSKAELEAQIKD
ncbi:MAG: hypothetical protein ACOX4I_02190 [Anaerovoracaceae bacterium]